MILDHLACFGPGDKFSKQLTLPLPPNFHESDVSKEISNTTVLDGTLLPVYGCAQRDWGGFISLTTLAPRNAYLNFSKAEDLKFPCNVSAPAKPAGRVHLRFNLLDPSGCLFNCSNLGYHETYYSFHQVLDESKETMVMIAMRGDDQPSSPFVRTGWVGIVGNNVLDIEHTKGFTLEISTNNKGTIGSLQRAKLQG